MATAEAATTKNQVIHNPPIMATPSATVVDVGHCENGVSKRFPRCFAPTGRVPQRVSDVPHFNIEALGVDFL